MQRHGKLPIGGANPAPSGIRIPLLRTHPFASSIETGSIPDRHDAGKLITTVDGIGPQTAARIIAAAGDPAQFKSAAAFAAFVGVVPCLRQSGKRTAARAGIGPIGHARLRRALWMPVLGAVRRNDWLRLSYERLRAAGKPAKLALIAAMRKLLCAIYSVAKNRKPFTLATTVATEQAREA